MKSFLTDSISTDLSSLSSPKTIHDLISNWKDLPVGIRNKDEFLQLEASSFSQCSSLEKSYYVQIGETPWGGNQSIILIMIDITQLKSNYTDMIYQKDQLLATASHELRTPLNGVLGLLDLVMEELEPSPIKEKIEVVVISGKLLLNMINDLLDLSLITNGRLQLNFEYVTLSSLIDETVKILRLQAAMKGIELNVENQLKNKNEIFRTDPIRSRQVLINLIGNAI